MPEPTEQDDIKEVPPEDAFSLLGHGTRIGIIQALWQAGDESVSFSELREHADVADSGQFNYHLGELVGTFITPISTWLRTRTEQELKGISDRSRAYCTALQLSTR